MKLPWKFRLTQAWELLTKGTDSRYEDLLGIYIAERRELEVLKIEISNAWQEFDHPEFKTWSKLKDPCRIAMKSWWNEYRRAHPVTVKKFS